MPRIFLIKPRNKQQKRQFSTTSAATNSVSEARDEGQAVHDEEERPEENKTIEDDNEQAGSIGRKRYSVDSLTSDEIIPSDTSSIQGK